MGLYKDVVALGIPHTNHYSDLYLPNTDQVRGLLKKHDKRGSPFQNQVEGGTWLDVPFAYEPYWDEVSDKAHHWKR